MKQKLAFCCAGLLCLLAACTDKSESLVLGQQGGICIIGSADGFTSLPQTRTQVGDVSEDGALLIEWSAGDRIGVFGDGSTANALFTGNNDAPAPTTTFAGTLTGGDMPVYAYYPYQEGVSDKTVIPIEIPAEQMYTDESSVAQYDFKASSEILADPSGGYRVQFRQLAALLRFEIDLTGVQSLADECLQDITIHQTETNVPMAGAFTYDLTQLESGLRSGEYSMDGITLVLENKPSVSDMIIAYAVLAPGNHAGNEWCCTFSTDRHQVTFNTTVLCNLEAGKYYTVPLNVTVLENNDATYEEIQQEPEEETANCYIVTETGEHDFKATVIGNGQKGIIPGAGFHTETAEIDPKSAKLLWTDVENFVSDVRLEADGRVHYQVNSLSGNAVIAVYSEPDQQGDILWSWHIWGTGGEMPGDEEYTNRVGSKVLAMDRNIGAHSKIDINAMLYQWGRKDPFPNALVYYMNGVTAEDVETSFPVYVSQVGTIEESVRHPEQMVKYIDNSYQDWLAVSNNYLWGDTNGWQPGWSEYLSDPACVVGWTDVKTIYDPSPVGYRVPNKFTWTYFVSRNDGNTSGISGVTNRLDYINYVKYENGYYFKRNETDTEGAYYPPVSKRYGSTGTMIAAGQGGELMLGESGFYWSSSPYNVGGTNVLYSAYFHFGRYTEEAGVTGYSSGNGVAVCDFISSRRDAHAVRCVREK